MPINAYTGLMGSGKSYECVSTVIVDAVRDGRRVVTNVDGIDNDEVRIYAHEKYGIPFDHLGCVDHCKNDDVLKPDFLPYGENIDTFCKAGDLVCIDEAWRFWGTDCKIHQNHYIFFREHRHYVNPVSKVSCDLALMVQDIADIHRKLRLVVELTMRTTKIKSLGLNKNFRIEMYEGSKVTAKTKLKTEVKKYDPRIFCLYSSYQGGTGKEIAIDDRQNLLKSKKVWFMLAGVILLLCFAISRMWSFFHPTAKPSASPTPSVGVLPAGGQAPSATPPKNTYSSTLRVAGYFTTKDGGTVIVQDSQGFLRYLSPSDFSEPYNYTVRGTIDGEKVTSFSGTSPASKSKPSILDSVKP